MSAPWGKTQLAPCGTYAAFRRHVRKREQACTPCSEAASRYRSDHRGRREPPAVTWARSQALKTLAERHPQEFRRLLAEALVKAQRCGSVS